MSYRDRIDLNDDGLIWFDSETKEIHILDEYYGIYDLKEFHDLVVMLSNAFIKACEVIKK